MQFPEVCAEVIKITNRPDKLHETEIAVNKAIAYCTLKGSFRQDLVETTIPINPNLYGDTISIASLTRFRRFTYVKPTGARYYLTPLSEDKIFTPLNKIQPNKYYVAGTNLTYVLSELAPSLEVGYLTYAPRLDATNNPSHWMLDIMPYAIIDLAAASIFAGIGDEASARRHEQLGLEFFLTVRKDLALGEMS